MAEDMGEKTELPTQRKIDEARSRGQLARSPDLVAALDLIIITILLVVFGAGVADACASVMRMMLTEVDVTLPQESILPLLKDSFIRPGIASMPIVGILVFASFLVHIAKHGWIWSTESLVPKFDRLNPVAGVGKLFGKRNVVRTIVNLVKLAIVGRVGYKVLLSSLDEVVSLPMLGVLGAWSAMGAIMLKLIAWLLAILLIIGLADFAYQKWQYTQDLKMTKQETEDERKSMEGDPNIKGRRYRMMRQIALQQINQAVPGADVIVTNPTHYSIAISYNPDTMAAPKVVAKGVDFMAMRIRQVAIVHGVPIVERPPLARALYASVEAGQTISPEFYQAVAEVLAYVYRLERQAA